MAAECEASSSGARAQLPSDSVIAMRLLAKIWKSLGGDRAALTRVSFSNEAFSLPSAFAVSDLAAASVAAAGLALSELVVATQESRSDSTDLVPGPAVEVDRRLASLWFSTSLRPIGGWAPPPLWDPVAGDYCTLHGAWIRLHTNAPHHRAAALATLGLPATADRAAVSAAVRDWDADALEAAVIAAGGCAATMRSVDAWASHPHGVAVAAAPLISVVSSLTYVAGVPGVPGMDTSRAGPSPTTLSAPAVDERTSGMPDLARLLPHELRL